VQWVELRVHLFVEEVLRLFIEGPSIQYDQDKRQQVYRHNQQVEE
jgi:hypothetical protein